MSNFILFKCLIIQFKIAIMSYNLGGGLGEPGFPNKKQIIINKLLQSTFLFFIFLQFRRVDNNNRRRYNVFHNGTYN
jgi:hypothetical protein